MRRWHELKDSDLAVELYPLNPETVIWIELELWGSE